MEATELLEILFSLNIARLALLVSAGGLVVAGLAICCALVLGRRLPK